MKFLWLVAAFSLSLYGSNPLQDAINSAEAGSKLEIPSGVYKGNIIIDKPLILDGKDRSAIIEGDGKGTVITIKSSNQMFR